MYKCTVSIKTDTYRKDPDKELGRSLGWSTTCIGDYSIYFYKVAIKYDHILELMEDLTTLLESNDVSIIRKKIEQSEIVYDSLESIGVVK